MSEQPRFNTKAFYDQNVRPQLRDLSRLQRWTQLLYLGGTLLAVSSLFASKLRIEVFDPQMGMYIQWAIAAVLFIAGYMTHLALKSRFKTTVMAKLIHALYPSFRYEPAGHISEEVYKASRLFPRHFTNYAGDDLIEGKVGQTDFSVSELHTQYTTHGPKGETRHHTIFRGLFFHADFHKHFNCTTFVFPDRAEAVLGKWLGQGLQAGLSEHGKIVKLENAEFERYFVTYSEDQQEARYLLSPTMMERMVRLRRKMDLNLYFGFLQGRVYVAISSRRDHFEPRVWGGAVSMNDIAEHRELLNSILGIVDELSLNERLWTKT